MGDSDPWDCTCPDHSTFDADLGKCVCGGDADRVRMIYDDSDNSNTCNCRAHETGAVYTDSDSYACTCPENSTYADEACTCNTGFKDMLDDKTCECPSGTTLTEGVCVCNIGGAGAFLDDDLVCKCKGGENNYIDDDSDNDCECNAKTTGALYSADDENCMCPEGASYNEGEDNFDNSPHCECDGLGRRVR